MCHELHLQGLNCERQIAVEVLYKGIAIKGQRLDLLVENEVILEIKSLSQLPEVAMAQILSYLRATGLKRGLLINFDEKRLTDGVKRISL
ncbi:GxxExxY protein [Bythopirellula polymerisocia]|uniref:GxxExxY protein n=1 Tax=Bythopirellula polymerisocia TaxID=2528003 RepID=UPI0028F45C8C|nr:GxxExxY protein [Bythopirellula polymerisocia]